MSTFQISGDRGPITDLESWFEIAPPKKGALQWKAGASALELARAWTSTGPRVPAEILRTLDSHPETAGFVAATGHAEAITRLDKERGEHRNHDLVVVGASAGVRTVLAIEAKAGEPFGDSSAGRYYAKQFGTASRVPHRVARLVQALTGEGVDPDADRELTSDLAESGYQLLTAAVGAVIEAQDRGCERAVVLVQQFVDETATSRQQSGIEKAKFELDRFVRILSSGAVTELASGSTVGPFNTHATEFVTGDVSFYVAECTTVIDTGGAPTV